ncbi:MAG TPA: class I SAM-dependent methyltransferase [Ktedonobacteraceae bacterium]|nr:class I SAM-dependent methyltransferase [Ktedonobacteraceae bacterium]
MATDVIAALERHRQDWEELANLDPLWAVLTRPEGQFGNWDLTKFFHTGENEILQIMRVAASFGKPIARKRALDFGCGVGRLSRALSQYFDFVDAVDISDSMINKAVELNTAIPNCQFHLNSHGDLRMFAAEHFDMVCSKIVLQHLPSEALIRSYLAEFIRILKPGGLLTFQLPSYIPLRNRLQGRRRVYRVLKRIGIKEEVLYKRLRLNPMRMNFIPASGVQDVLRQLGSTVLASIPNEDAGPAIPSLTYYVTK